MTWSKIQEIEPNFIIIKFEGLIANVVPEKNTKLTYFDRVFFFNNLEINYALRNFPLRVSKNR